MYSGTTPADVTRRVGVGDMVRIGDSFQNDHEVMAITSTHLVIATPCLGGPPETPRALFRLQRDRDRADGGGGGAPATTPPAVAPPNCLAAATAVQCLASPACMWDPVVVSCTPLPKDGPPARWAAGVKVNAAGGLQVQLPPLPPVVAGINISLASAQPPDLKINFPKLKLPSVSCVRRRHRRRRRIRRRCCG